MAVVAPHAPQLDERDLGTDRPDTLAPSFWASTSSEISANSTSAASKYYHYPDAVFSDEISKVTREWLRAAWTDEDKVKEMIDAGADVQLANANGFTALHMAASRFKLSIAEILVEAGHDVNAVECNGLTPLDYCVDGGMQGEGSVGLKTTSREYAAMVDFLESKGAYRKEERCWMKSANQEKHAPYLPQAS